MGWFAELYRRRGKSKVMLLNGEEGIECKVHVDEIHLEHVSKFKYLSCVLEEAATDGAKCSRKVDLQFECDRVFNEHCLYLFLCMAVRQCYRKRRRDLELGL